MVDILTKKQRSYCMSRIRSKWTKPEKLIHNKLKSLKIKHQMHPKIGGKPDIVLKDKKIAIFLHGCFWHRCKKCYKEPKSNKKFWLPKIEKNVERDKKSIRLLKSKEWKVIIIWEHEVKNNIMKAIKKCLAKMS